MVQCVLDLWAGHVDAARARPWQSDTLVNLFSVGKISAVRLLRLVEAGRVDLDAPSRATGPEFARRLRGDGRPLEGLALMRFNAYFNLARLSGMEIVNSRAWRALKS